MIVDKIRNMGVALAVSAAALAPVGASAEVSQEQKEQNSIAIANCVFGEVVTELQAAYAHNKYNIEQVKLQVLNEVEEVTSFNSLVPCFMDVTGLQANNLPDVPKAYFVHQLQSGEELDLMKQWAVILSEHADEDKYTEVYESQLQALTFD